MRSVRVTVSSNNNGRENKTFLSVDAAKKYADKQHATGKKAKLKIKISN